MRHCLCLRRIADSTVVESAGEEDQIFKVEAVSAGKILQRVQALENSRAQQSTGRSLLPTRGARLVNPG